MGVGRWHNTMMVHFSTQGFWDDYEPFHCTQNNSIRGTTCHLHTGNGRHLVGNTRRICKPVRLRCGPCKLKSACVRAVPAVKDMLTAPIRHCRWSIFDLSFDACTSCLMLLLRVKLSGLMPSYCSLVI